MGAPERPSAGALQMKGLRRTFVWMAVVVLGTGALSRVALPVDAADVVLVGAGDIADCRDLSGAEATAKLLDGIPGIVFALADLGCPNGSRADFEHCYDPTWGRHRARTWPSLGHHEYQTAHAAGYFAYWGDQAGGLDKGYYSYEAGAWHVVVINSNCDEVGGCHMGSPQGRWLRADLQAHPSACAYWHHPLFSSGVKRPTPDIRRCGPCGRLSTRPARSSC